MTAAGHGSPEESLSIGRVIELLLPEFPDLTVSKVRFLENEGLVSPQRTASGYRRFSAADRERLRYVLAAQRERYLPLKVIREELEQLDRAVDGGDGIVTALRPREVPGSTADDFRSDAGRRLTREDVCAQAGVEAAFVDELVGAGLLAAGPGGYFDADGVVVVRLAHQLGEHGVGVRHLRAFRNAADRQSSLIAQITEPVARKGDVDARDRAAELSREIAALSVSLHSALVTVAVRQAFGG